jgi:hypothetical protein
MPISQGPRDAHAAFAGTSGKLTVIDGRGTVWQWDDSVTEDAEGKEIKGPPDVKQAFCTDNTVLVVDSSGAAWSYNLHNQAWTEQLNTTDVLDGEAEKEYEPWKKGNNVTVPAPTPETAPTKSHKKRAKEDA